MDSIIETPHECPVSEVRDINTAVILSGVWPYFGQTQSKDLRLRMPTYITDLWDTRLGIQFPAANRQRRMEHLATANCDH